MEKLFGLEMATIAGALSAILVLVIASLALLAWRRPVFLKLGLRPIPRRRAQSILIVLGLMLATLIITAAFITGDTLSHSIRSVAIEGMGEIDELVQVSGGSTDSSYFKMARCESLAAQMAGYPLVDRLLPAINESAPVVNVTRRSSRDPGRSTRRRAGVIRRSPPQGFHRPRCRRAGRGAAHARQPSPGPEDV
ncbi:MAG: ABC transporter permease [Burkholderiales bacterium]|nr:ABC transporter permease [Burkholderiales bacterium]